MLTLLFVTGCKKDATDVSYPPVPSFPESWGMIGTTGADGFSASSLNAALIKDTLSGKYTLNVNGWDASTDRSIYLHYKDLSFEAGNYYVFRVNSPGADSSFVFYQKDHLETEFGAGLLTIYGTADSLVKGTYDFTTASGLRIQGVYTIRPHYFYE